MMTPITRKEKYINQIVGGGDTAPKTPQTREEFFFAEILGEVIAPSPVTRTEKYLSAIAGQYGGDLPTPITRIEYFLARAAGMDVTIPTPITREEMLWANYALIVEKELSGIPPLTFKAKKAGTLNNYRIYGNTETKTRSYSGSAPLSFPIVDGAVSNYRVYGNTVNGESVGDKTENIFDKSKANRIYDTARNADGTMNYNTLASNYIDYYIPVKPNTDYSIKGKKKGTTGYVPSRLYFFDANKVWINRTDPYDYESNIIQFTTPSSCNFIQMQEDKYREMDFVTLMIAEGSTVPENYIPYGYRIPITNNSETANIYLDEPLRKVGDEAEYVDYATQKWHRVRKNLCPYESTNNTIIGHVKQGKTYTFSFYALYECGFNLQKRNADSGQTSMFITRSNCNGNVEVTFQAGENFDLYFNGYSQTTGKTTTDCVSKLQLEESSAATSYEPYIENTEVDVTIPDLPAQSSSNSLSVGTAVQPSSLAVDVAEVVSCGDKVTDSQSVNYGKYKIPVTLTAGSAETTDIYLDTPLAKSGNNADYIDYATQKRHNSDGTESSITLPAISTLADTNTLTVGTEVQPSNVYIKYEGER